MLTPQEVSSHAFPKAVMGGYNMAAVDEFLDELTDDYTALYKENTALKSKLKVLVEKVEDYRSTEDSMRATLLTAQKMADSIVKEAEAKRDQMLAQAEKDAREKIGRLQDEVATAQERLKAGQLEMAKFIAASRETCSRQLEYLDQLPQLEVELPARDTQEAAETAQADTVGQIEQKIFSTFQAEEPAAQPEAAEEQPAEPTAAPAEEYPSGNPFAAKEPEEEPVEEPTRRIDLKDLKFGRNYSGD